MVETSGEMEQLRHVVSEFRDGILDGGSSAFMCIAVCAPLEGYLRVGHGIETHAVAGTVDLGDYNMEHFWLEMADGTVIDPTADQFEELHLPPVYIGPRPEAYLVEERISMADTKEASRRAREAFVKMIKDENFYMEPYSRWSLKQHWSGADGGFADDQLQKRWRDFEKGWKAAKGIDTNGKG